MWLRGGKKEKKEKAVLPAADYFGSRGKRAKGWSYAQKGKREKDTHPARCSLAGGGGKTGSNNLFGARKKREGGGDDSFAFGGGNNQNVSSSSEKGRKRGEGPT